MRFAGIAGDARFAAAPGRSDGDDHAVDIQAAGPAEVDRIGSADAWLDTRWVRHPSGDLGGIGNGAPEAFRGVL